MKSLTLSQKLALMRAHAATLRNLRNDRDRLLLSHAELEAIQHAIESFETGASLLEASLVNAVLGEVKP